MLGTITNKLLLRTTASVAVVGLAYFVAGKFAMLLATVHPAATAVWPHSGIALAALLLFGSRVGPGILLGAFLVYWTMAGSVVSSLGIALGCTLQCLTAAYLTDRFACGPRAFERPQDVIKFTL